MLQTIMLIHFIVNRNLSAFFLMMMLSHDFVCFNVFILVSLECMIAKIDLWF